MIDSHAHLDMEAFDPDREKVLARAKAAGVQKIVSLGLMDEKASYRKAFQIVDAHPEIYTTIGCSPHDARHFGPQGEKVLEEAASHPRLLAVGEIGLDYHYNLSPPEVQREVFRRQIRVARKLELPLIIHHREAEQDLVAILDEEKSAEVSLILHSFTASGDLALAALGRGFFISFSGILTFKNATPLREVAGSIPLGRLLVETDCPYLAPVPHRGKRNEPAFVRQTADELAKIKGISSRDLETASDENFHHFFGL